MNSIQEKLTQGPQTGRGAETNVFLRNLELIRPVALAIAAVVFVGMWCVFMFAVFPSDAKMRLEPLAIRILVALVPGAFLAAYVLLIGFIYVDAKRRGMRPVMWTLLAVFVPSSVGIILYFVLREPLPIACPKCNYLARGAYAFCPNCGSELLRACRVCHKKIEPGWANCAYCGAPIGGQTAKTG